MERTLRLIQRAHEGDKEARDILVEENVGLVWSIVRRFQNRGVESEDLFQIGTIGLIKAVDKFDCSYEVCFSTYAVPMNAVRGKHNILTRTLFKYQYIVEILLFADGLTVFFYAKIQP